MCVYGWEGTDDVDVNEGERVAMLNFECEWIPVRCFSYSSVGLGDLTALYLDLRGLTTS